MLRWAGAITSALFPSSPASADWFAEAALGGSPAPLGRVEYNDPVGAVFTTNAKHGSGIIPSRVSGNPWTIGAAASVGYLSDHWYFLRATYRYFGDRAARGDGIFFHDTAGLRPPIISQSMPQKITVGAQGIFLGLGVQQSFGDGWFVDASIEAGASFLQAAGTRDVGTPIEQPFPANMTVNLTYGAGLGVGRRIAPNVAIVFGATWDHLGRAQTGFAPDIGGAPVFAPELPPRASMTGTVGAVSITLGIRYSF
jgi:hypothetical protein